MCIYVCIYIWNIFRISDDQFTLDLQLPCLIAGGWTMINWWFIQWLCKGISPQHGLMWDSTSNFRILKFPSIYWQASQFFCAICVPSRVQIFCGPGPAPCWPVVSGVLLVPVSQQVCSSDLMVFTSSSQFVGLFFPMIFARFPIDWELLT